MWLNANYWGSWEKGSQEIFVQFLQLLSLKLFRDKLFQNKLFFKYFKISRSNSWLGGQIHDLPEISTPRNDSLPVSLSQEGPTFKGLWKPETPLMLPSFSWPLLTFQPHLASSPHPFLTPKQTGLPSIPGTTHKLSHPQMSHPQESTYHYQPRSGPVLGTLEPSDLPRYGCLASIGLPAPFYDSSIHMCLSSPDCISMKQSRIWFCSLPSLALCFAHERCSINIRWWSHEGVNESWHIYLEEIVPVRFKPGLKEVS